MNTATASSTVSGRRGRKVDPKSNFSQAKEIYNGFASDQRTRANVVQAFVDKLGLKEATANVYYYNVKRELKDAAVTTV